MGLFCSMVLWMAKMNAILFSILLIEFWDFFSLSDDQGSFDGESREIEEHCRRD